MTTAPPPPPPSVPSAAEVPPPPPGPPVRPPLRRSRTDRVIGGVAGGLAEYSGIDALLWRVGFVALAFAGGTGVLVYLLLWVLMPAGPASRTDADRPPAGPRSPVARVTVAGLLIVVGLLVLVSRFTDVDLGPRGFLGTALLMVGLGLVATAFLGGRGAKAGLIGLGVVLSVALIAASSLPWRGMDRQMGDRTYHPTSAAAVRPMYHGGVGDVTLDLSDLDVSDLDRPVTTRLDAGVGDVEVLVPRSADVRIDVDSGIGQVEVFGEDSDGGFYPGTGSAAWTGDGDPEIVLTIDAGIGDVEVSRV
ncbi:MAG TPA: PspC domain-containing protein [Geodermatophilus sp.]|nr:PspC domain-containing protein [Geodermatophilus sp.]